MSSSPSTTHHTHDTPTSTDETAATTSAGGEEQPYVDSSTVEQDHATNINTAAVASVANGSGADDDIQNSIEVAVLTALGRRHNSLLEDQQLLPSVNHIHTMNNNVSIINAITQQQQQQQQHHNNHHNHRVVHHLNGGGGVDHPANLIGMPTHHHDHTPNNDVVILSTCSAAEDSNSAAVTANTTTTTTTTVEDVMLNAAQDAVQQNSAAIATAHHNNAAIATTQRQQHVNTNTNSVNAVQVDAHAVVADVIAAAAAAQPVDRVVAYHQQQQQQPPNKRSRINTAATNTPFTTNPGGSSLSATATNTATTTTMESNKAVMDAAARDRWLIKFGELRHFRATNGHCNVPRNCKESLQLGKWVNNQRFEYKKYIQGKTSKMSDERIKLLEGEGFQWSMVEHVPWEQRFNEVVAYKAIHGNCRVPKRYPTNQPLANWVDKQRKEYKLLQNGKKSSMSEKRIEFLNGVGFAWVAISEVSWEERLQELISYKAVYGNCLVPNKYQDNHALGRWVDKQRQDYRKFREGKRSVMTEERIKVLETHSFCWSVDDYAWEQRLGELVEYKTIHGSCLVPHNYSANSQLANWVIQQRQDYKKLCHGRKSAMKQHRFAKLNAAGFEWNAGRAHAAQHALGPRPVYPPATYPITTGVAYHQPHHAQVVQPQSINAQHVVVANNACNTSVANPVDHVNAAEQHQHQETVVVDEASIIDMSRHQHHDGVLDPVSHSHVDQDGIANV